MGVAPVQAIISFPREQTELSILVPNKRMEGAPPLNCREVYKRQRQAKNETWNIPDDSEAFDVDESWAIADDSEALNADQIDALLLDCEREPTFPEDS